MLCFHFNYIHTHIHIYILGLRDNIMSLNSQLQVITGAACSSYHISLVNLLSSSPTLLSLRFSNLKHIFPPYSQQMTHLVLLRKQTDEGFHSPPPPPLWWLHCSTGDLSTLLSLTSTWMPGHHPFPPTWARQSYNILFYWIIPIWIILFLKDLSSPHILIEPSSQFFAPRI